MEKMNISTGISTSSLPCSLRTSAAMPASSAPVSVMMPRKPPKIITNRQTPMASWKPKTGAVRTCDKVAPSTPSTPQADMMTVTMARTTRMMSKMVNDDRLARFFFLPFSAAAMVIPPYTSLPIDVGPRRLRKTLVRLSGPPLRGRGAKGRMSFRLLRGNKAT